MTIPDLTCTYAATIDAGTDATVEALAAIDPMATLATRLSALGVDDARGLRRAIDEYTGDPWETEQRRTPAALSIAA